ncbi:unnamed protein product [Durusdinium trenchii]|uniref:Uncharacterized protein n=2 Tax=Durusdinium trenchii TaxID=1381693 RepID=A0ABP0QAW6_9DINO
MGPECGSWGLPARGTSKRTFCNAFGAMHLDFVSHANECVAKLVLCLYLIVAKHGYFVLEQPAQSLLVKAPRFEHFVNHVCFVFVTRFWMQLLGHPSPKPTVVYSNGSWVKTLDLGVLKKEFRIANTSLKTTRLSPREVLGRFFQLIMPCKCL